MDTCPNENPETCAISGGKVASYFKLERGIRQGDPIAVRLFVLALEVVFS